MDTRTILETSITDNWDHTFIVDPATETTLTYGQFLSRAEGYSQLLKELGLNKGDQIILILNNSLKLSILYFAIFISELVAVPIDPKKGSEEISEIITITSPKMIIRENSIDYQGKELPAEMLFANDSLVSPSITRDLVLQTIREIDTSAVFLISFTSGSTGTPKGVMHSFDNLTGSALAFRKAFGINSTNVFYHILPMTYMAGVLNLIILPFISGSRIVLGERFSIANISKFWKTPISNSVNTFWLIPTIISLLMTLDRGREGIDAYSENPPLIFVGTAPLNSTLRKQFTSKYQIPLYESYGLTETLFVSTNRVSCEDPGESVGEPLDDVHLEFAPDCEILIDVPWRFLGYYHEEGSKLTGTDRRFFPSGDIGFINENKQLFITGRKKDLIIRGGINISPKKTEALILKSSIFRECAIIGISDSSLGEKTVCFYTLSPESSVAREDIKKLNASIIQQLGPNYSIDDFIYVTDIPKNLNGKIDKKELLRIYVG